MGEVFNKNWCIGNVSTNCYIEEMTEIFFGQIAIYKKKMLYN